MFSFNLCLNYCLENSFQNKFVRNCVNVFPCCSSLESTTKVNLMDRLENYLFRTCLSLWRPSSTYSKSYACSEVSFLESISQTLKV